MLKYGIDSQLSDTHKILSLLQAPHITHLLFVQDFQKIRLDCILLA